MILISEEITNFQSISLIKSQHTSTDLGAEISPFM